MAKRKAAGGAAAEASSGIAGEALAALRTADEDGVALVGEAAGSAGSGPASKKKARKVYKLSKCPCCEQATEACSAWVAESKNRQGRRILEGPGCMRCFELYEAGGYKLMKAKKLDTFDMFCVACDSDADFRESCKAALQVMTKARKRDDDDEECGVQTLEGWRIEEHFVGVTAKNFQRLHGCTITEAGYKQQDLPNAKGGKFKGLLVSDGEESNIRYVKYTDNLVLRKVLKLSAGSAVRKEQGKDTFDREVADESKRGLWQKLRCCALTERDIKDQVAKKGLAKPSGGGSAVGANGPIPLDDDEEEEDEEGEEEDDEDDEEEEGGPEDEEEEQAGGRQTAAKAERAGAPARCKTPVKGTRDDGEVEVVSDSKSVSGRGAFLGLGVSPPSGAVKSPGARCSFDALALLREKIGGGGSGATDWDASSRVSGLGNHHEGGGKKSDWNKKKTVEQHIRDTPHSGILGGAKLKVALRFAKLALEEKTVKADVASHSMLSVHVKTAQDCYSLVETDWEKVDLADLQKLVAPLVDSQVEFPTSMKTRLLVKHALAQCSSPGLLGAAGLKLVVDMVTPWCFSGDVPDFDPQHPQLVTIEGSPKEKACIFADILVDRILCVLIKAGERDKETTLRVVSFFEDAYKDFGAMDDDYLEVLSVMLSAWRALRTLLTPARGDGFEEVVAIYNAVHSKTEPALLKKIAVVMWNTSYYKDLLTDFHQKKVFTSQCMPRVTSALGHLEAATDGNGPTFGELSDAVQVYDECASRARVGLGEYFLSVLAPCLEKARDNFNDMVKRPPGDEQHEVDLKSAHSLFSLVAKTLPIAVINVTKEMALASKRVQQMQQQAKSKDIIDKYSEITSEWYEGASADDFKGFIGITAGVDQSGFEKKDMSFVAEVLLTGLSSEQWGSPKASASLDVLVEMKGTAFFELRDECSDAIRALVACRGVGEKMSEWQAGGDDLKSRVANDKNSEKLRGAVAALKGALADMAACKRNMPNLEPELQGLSQRTDEARKEILDTKQKEVESALDTMHSAMGNVIGPDRNWKDTLRANATWAGLVKTAKKTLLELKSGETSVTNTLAALSKAHFQYKADTETFEATYPAELESKVQLAMSMGYLGMWEAKFLLGIEAMGGDLVKLRKLGQTLQKELGDENRDIKGKEHPLFAARLSDLLAMKRGE